MWDSVSLGRVAAASLGEEAGSSVLEQGEIGRETTREEKEDRGQA
jgi:hypothetical protein